MARRRVIKGVVHNFLGTLSSRYSDYDGYWVFGLLVSGLNELTIDLLSDADIPDDSVLTHLIRLARERFSEQLVRQRLALSSVRSASLQITRSPAPTIGVVNGHRADGYEVTLCARVVSDLHTAYAGQVTVFVAPHNAEIEIRSTREGSP
jgi:hypothetical protein